jgi:hypothetical protein
MESLEREESCGALPAFDRQAHPHSLQEVPGASARPETNLKGVPGPSVMRLRL